MSNNLKTVVVALLIVLSPFVGAAETILLDTYSGEIVLGQTQIQYLEDAEDTLTIEQLRGNHKTRFSPSTQDVLNFGHTDSSIWVHFAFTDRQTLEQYQTWILHSSFPLLARFDLYIFQDNELKHTYNLGIYQRHGAKNIAAPLFCTTTSNQ